MLKIDPKNIETPKLHSYLLAAVGPRPIALVSTINESGVSNLSPYSFFNIFSANPPIAIFSPARRVRNNTTKHTLENVIKNKEAVINIVSYKMVQQTSLSSTEYDEGIDEFKKAGFTAIPSNTIKPFRVKESPVQLECKIKDIISLGNKGGSGNLVISEINMIHINEEILDENGIINPNKIDLIGRMGGDWYCRASNDAIFKVEKPLKKLGIGVDNIPNYIANSNILSGNDLGILGNVEKLPTLTEIKKYVEDNAKLLTINLDNKKNIEKLHLIAKKLIADGKTIEAWKTLLINKIIKK